MKDKLDGSSNEYFQIPTRTRNRINIETLGNSLKQTNFDEIPLTSLSVAARIPNEEGSISWSVPSKWLVEPTSILLEESSSLVWNNVV